MSDDVRSEEAYARGWRDRGVHAAAVIAEKNAEIERLSGEVAWRDAERKNMLAEAEANEAALAAEREQSRAMREAQAWWYANRSNWKRGAYRNNVWERDEARAALATPETYYDDNQRNQKAMDERTSHSYRDSPTSAPMRPECGTGVETADEVVTPPSALISRLREAEGADRQLDYDIAAALDLIPEPDRGYMDMKRLRDGTVWILPPLTASIDAALALKERLLPEWWVQLIETAHNNVHWTVYIQTCDPAWREASGEGPTLPLALLIATLTAGDA